MKIARHLVKGISIVVLMLLGQVSQAQGAPLLFENFDSLSSGETPAGWTISQPGNTSVGVTDTVSVSTPNSLEFMRSSTATGGPSISASFDSISSAVVRVTLDMRTTTSNHDSLYLKLRNTGNQELGGIRFNTNATFGYQASDGTWVSSSLTYSANTWYSVQIDYDLNAHTYSAWVDGSLLIAETPFRATTTIFNAANILVQSRSVVGAGSAFIDNVEVNLAPIPEPSSISLLGVGSITAMIGLLRRHSLSEKNSERKPLGCHEKE